MTKKQPAKQPKTQPKPKRKNAKKPPVIKHTRAVLDEMALALDLDPNLYRTRGDLWEAIKAQQETGGRPRRWTWAKQLEEDIERYIAKATIKTVVGFCVDAKISRTTLGEYRSGTYDTKSEDFSYTIKSRLDPACEAHLLEKGLSGDHSAPVSIFALKNLHAYADKIEMSGPGGESLDGSSKMVDATNAIATAMEKHFKTADRGGDRDLPDGE